jgi:hypothetical protein
MAFGVVGKHHALIVCELGGLNLSCILMCPDNPVTAGSWAGVGLVN